METLSIFSNVRMDADRYCVLYKSNLTERYLPVILYGDQGDMVESHCLHGMSPQHMQIIEFSTSLIQGVGAVFLYGELCYDTVREGICGRIACRQQNQVNKIFSLIDAPPAYVIAMELPLVTDSETLDHMAFGDMADVSDAIGFNMNEIGEER